jgi:hypothetical protein
MRRFDPSMSVAARFPTVAQTWHPDKNPAARHHRFREQDLDSFGGVQVDRAECAPGFPHLSCGHLV